MGHASDEPLDRRLDRLEHRGRAALVGAARRAALADAATIAAHVAPIVPIALLLLACLMPVATGAALLWALLVPLAVFAGIAGVRMARIAVGRDAALGMVDRTLLLKDRATIAAEFLAAPVTDGFRAAALAEAAPWLRHAGTARIARPTPVRRSLRRPAALATGSLVVLAAALSMPSPHAPGPVAGTMGRIARGVGLSPALPAGGERADAAADDAAGGALREGGSGAAGSSGGAVGASGRGAMPGTADRAAGTAGAAAGSARSGGDAGAAAANAGAGGARGNAASGASPAGAVLPGRSGDVDRRTSDAGDHGRGSAAAAPESRATPASGMQGGAGTAPAGGVPPPARSAGGQQGQQGSGARSRQSSGSSGSGNQPGANNGSQSGSASGDGSEGAKRARGATSLMLAVPMADRVIGTINAGAVSSTLRDAPPRAMAAGTVAAGSRGAGAGRTGRVRHDARTVQEDRMLARRFRRAGVDQ